MTLIFSGKCTSYFPLKVHCKRSPNLTRKSKNVTAKKKCFCKYNPTGIVVRWTKIGLPHQIRDSNSHSF